ncbi:THUMP domain-containing protein 1 homolog isoform X2 [Ooceraea biroi]|uniref:THUMP domain-containing protein 1 homolog isoform X2 n=1 Tax=Ooceraea biroi TaxID=2015173 RepID=UPI0005BA825A|nr:THUMP domain-containing protein 1 homolog isoform X2 [Ooceraea biroi]
MQANGTMNTRKRNNRHFANHRDGHKKRRQLTLEPGMTGFLCTCNFHERGCVTDAYKLLNLFADEESAPEVKKEPEGLNVANTLDKSSEDADKSSEDDDISTALKKEITELRTEHELPLSSRRFQVVDTGVKNMIFVASTLPNPLELVTKIVTQLDVTKKQCTRYLLRLLPIQVICKAYMNDIRTKASALFEKYFAQEPKTFSIVFNRRSNNSIKRNEIIEDLAEIIARKNPGNKADLKNPEIAVVVEVIRGICLLSIAPNYYKFKKYNLIEICNSAKPKEQKSENKEIKEEGVDTVSSTQELEKLTDTDTSLNAEIEEKKEEN